MFPKCRSVCLLCTLRAANLQYVAIAHEDTVVCGYAASTVDATATYDAYGEQFRLLAAEVVGELTQRAKRFCLFLLRLLRRSFRRLQRRSFPSPWFLRFLQLLRLLGVPGHSAITAVGGLFCGCLSGCHETLWRCRELTCLRAADFDTATRTLVGDAYHDAFSRAGVCFRVGIRMYPTGAADSAKT